MQRSWSFRPAIAANRRTRSFRRIWFPHRQNLKAVSFHDPGSVIPKPGMKRGLVVLENFIDSKLLDHLITLATHAATELLRNSLDGAACSMSAMSPKFCNAAKCRDVPTRDSCTAALPGLFDHLVGAGAEVASRLIDAAGKRGRFGSTSWKTNRMS